MAVELDVWADDFMDRKPSSEFLTRYILSNPHIKVLNVNSPWGAGKSFFLNRWKADLSKEHVCVLFNAWETDYSAEPLVALITSIEQQTKDKLDVTAHEAGRRAVDLGANLLRKAAPLIAKGLVKKFIGVEFDDLLGSEGGDNAADSAKDLVSSLIDDQSKTSMQVDEFKQAVLQRLNQASEDNGLKKPAFIFIDELDRCRPTYAIELLERIKHFFELEDCRFIIASDSAQLAHSIRAVYGQGFASERYLNRFFDAEFNLDNQDIFSMVHSSLPEISSMNLGINITGSISRSRWHPKVEPRYPQKNTVTSELDGFTENSIIIVGLYRYFKIELRELVNYLKQIKSAADSLGENVHFFWLAFLVFYKNSKHESYNSLFDKDKGAKELASFDKEKANVVTFSFSTSLDTIHDFASYYLTMLNADKEELSSMSHNASGWRTNVYFPMCNNMPLLHSYKRVVDLAHRLS